MINIMIPLGKAYEPMNTNSELPDYGELKYCLRSVEKHLSNVGIIYLLFGTSALPTWLNPESVNMDFKADLFKNEYKERNIYSKILTHLQKEQRFLFMNDDHFMLQDFNADTFPNFIWDKTIAEVRQGIKGNTPYSNTLDNTLQVLPNEAKYFDIHCPIIYEREKFLNAFGNLIMSKPYGYCLKSIYGNRNDLPAIIAADVKIYAVSTYESIMTKIEGAQFFSTNDNVFGNSMIQILEELYPTKSKYEL